MISVVVGDGAKIELEMEVGDEPVNFMSRGGGWVLKVGIICYGDGEWGWGGGLWLRCFTIYDNNE